MRKRIGVIILACLFVGLLALFLILTMAADRTGPVISFDKEEIFFNASDDTSILLEGVHATDDRDGDVSSSLVVQDIIYGLNNSGTVVYVARDSSNNVTTVKKTFTYEETMPVDEGNGGEPGGEVIPPAEQDVGVEPQPEEAQPAVADGELSEDEYAALKQQQLDQGLPYIRLLQHVVYLQVGTNFTVQRYIAEAVNKDNDAYQRIRVGGDTVNSRRAGTYEVQVYITDGDGNQSNIENMRVVVQ